MPNPAAPRKGRPLFAALILGGLIWFAIYGIGTIDALLLNPWALSLTGAPTLPGTWTGEMTIPGEGARRVALRLRHSTRTRCRDCDIDGTFRLCRGTTAERSYRIGGDNDTRSGDRFHLTLYADSDLREGEVRFGRLSGEWDRDTIRFTAPWVRHAMTVGTSESSSGGQTEAPAVRFELRRGGSADC